MFSLLRLSDWAPIKVYPYYQQVFFSKIFSLFLNRFSHLVEKIFISSTFVISSSRKTFHFLHLHSLWDVTKAFSISLIGEQGEMDPSLSITYSLLFIGDGFCALRFNALNGTPRNPFGVELCVSFFCFLQRARRFLNQTY